jgi:hypothetical protein
MICRIWRVRFQVFRQFLTFLNLWAGRLVNAGFWKSTWFKNGSNAFQKWLVARGCLLVKAASDPKGANGGADDVAAGAAVYNITFSTKRNQTP